MSRLKEVIYRGLPILYAVTIVLGLIFFPISPIVTSSSPIGFSIGVERLEASTTWVLPTGHTANGWSDPTYAYDSDTGTYAYIAIAKNSWSNYLEFSRAATTCDRVRVWVSRAGTRINTVSVDVYYSGAWTQIYSGSPTLNNWAEYTIGSTQSVTGLRVRLYAASNTDTGRIHEVNFGEVTAAPEITSTPSSFGFGVLQESSINWSNGSTPSFPLTSGDCYFYISNPGSISIDVTAKCTNFTGGVGWSLTSGSPGENTVRTSVFREGNGSGDGLILTTSEQSFTTALGASSSLYWDIKIETGTFTDGIQKSGTITFTAYAS